MKDRVKKYYEKRAKTYEDLNKPTTIVSSVRSIGINDHLEIMDVKREDLILDVGCGQGRFLGPLNARSSVVGLDFTVEIQGRYLSVGMQSTSH
jgi:ubiquinone/menaquinone biosynthesis C-methylase UbiE